MKTLINGRLIVPDESGNFGIAQGKALNFGAEIFSIGEPVGSEIIDVQGAFVSSGFINVHIHGADSVDTMDDDIAALYRLAKFLPTTGVTSFLPTTMTMPLEKIHGALTRIRAAKNFSDGARILGAHLEGPFISKKFHGAQNPADIIPADFALIEPFADVIKIITVAPEECPDEFITRCRRRSIVVSIGHSAAASDEALRAIDLGANHITHLFNAQTGIHHRQGGVALAALISHATVELIADDVHVCPAAQCLVAKCKPRSEIVLVTDSFRACGVGDGESSLGGQKVFVRGTLATLADGTIAGSVAAMNTVLKNFRHNVGWDVPACVELVTKNPALELNLYDKLGSLEVGKLADITCFDDNFNIVGTFIGGREI